MKENEIKSVTKHYYYQKALLSPVRTLVKTTWNKITIRTGT